MRREGIEPTMNINSTDLQSAALTARPSPTPYLEEVKNVYNK